SRLKLPAAAIDTGRGFAELGLDSLGPTELAFALGEHIGKELSETIAYDYPTIQRLVDHIAPAASRNTTADAPAHQPAFDSSAQVGTDLDDLLDAIERGEP